MSHQVDELYIHSFHILLLVLPGIIYQVPGTGNNYQYYYCLLLKYARVRGHTPGTNVTIVPQSDWSQTSYVHVDSQHSSMCFVVIVRDHRER